MNRTAWALPPSMASKRRRIDTSPLNTNVRREHRNFSSKTAWTHLAVACRRLMSPHFDPLRGQSEKRKVLSCCPVSKLLARGYLSRPHQARPQVSGISKGGYTEQRVASSSAGSHRSTPDQPLSGGNRSLPLTTREKDTRIVSAGEGGEQRHATQMNCLSP